MTPKVHYLKIANDLASCKPALILLVLSGFSVNEAKGIFWTNTKYNMVIVKYIQDTLQSMIDHPQVWDFESYDQEIWEGKLIACKQYRQKMQNCIIISYK